MIKSFQIQIFSAEQLSLKKGIMFCVFNSHVTKCLVRRCFLCLFSTIFGAKNPFLWLVHTSISVGNSLRFCQRCFKENLMLGGTVFLSEQRAKCLYRSQGARVDGGSTTCHQTLPLCRAPPASHPDRQGDADANGFKNGFVKFTILDQDHNY